MSEQNTAETLRHEKFCRLSNDEIFRKLKTTEKGLSHSEVEARQKLYGPNSISQSGRKLVVFEFLSKFINPLIITLFIVAAISYSLGEKINSIIVILMAFLSTILSFFQEHRANKNAEKLAEMVKIKIKVIRGSEEKEIGISEVVLGDIVVLAAGDMIPADLKVISNNDLFINQSVLTGESFPVEKTGEPQTGENPLSLFDSKNLAFMGSSVVSGLGQAVVIATGKDTQFGALGKEIVEKRFESAFEKGIKNFTWLMIRFILILAFFIFIVLALFKNQVVDALLFALAIAVGLAPEMLPMITTVTLSKGAQKMAKKKIIVKRLDSIQNFGAMDVLCADKTGTLTLNEITLVRHCNVMGEEDEKLLELAYQNSYYQTGLIGILDRAVLKFQRFKSDEKEKVDEIPYDFARKMVSVIIKHQGKEMMITKGAPEEVLKRSTLYKAGDENKKITEEITAKINKLYDNMSKDGFRVLAVAYKEVGDKKSYSKDDEKDFIFGGFVSFLDPVKPKVRETILTLEKQGIKLKILSGDNELVTRKICKEVDLVIEGLVVGDQIEKMDQGELLAVVRKTNVFVRLNPMQKERIVEALKTNGDVVGFLGDGINDAPALKAADVGISVNNATDVAKETASIILLEHDLQVLSDCVSEGRKTFANIVKYIKMGASSNLGNMISLTGASVFLPFLPMLPGQILLNNFLYDVSQVAIPSDNVDSEYLAKPRPWDIAFIRNFMLIIGPISSIFDFATFGILWFVFHASPDLFRTGWFVESLFTQTMVIHIIRTRKIPFIQSLASKALLLSTVIIAIIGIILPYTALGRIFSFRPLPLFFLAILAVLSLIYLFLVQIVKNLFVKKFGYE